MSVTRQKNFVPSHGPNMGSMSNFQAFTSIYHAFAMAVSMAYTSHTAFTERAKQMLHFNKEMGGCDCQIIFYKGLIKVTVRLPEAPAGFCYWVFPEDLLEIF